MRPIKFIVTGAAAAAVHLWVLWLLVDLTQLAPLLANPAAFILAFVVSYLGHSLWTFNHKQHVHRNALVKFLLVQLLCSFVLNQSLYTLLLTYTALNYLMASFIVLATIPLVTYTLSKYWAFK
ncbi:MULTISPECIES: GtrA family protein [unclassified Endozoicomonas]|uniref:GtrA family protein n=2 Tax=Endozoicomonas TaxID=305899 RepID=UPI0021498411|nr:MULTISPECIES: GtrA family protein [unclassified Endozoicomonas]